jgi:hypothetical protein
MKKLILLSVLAIGLGASGATAQAGGLSVRVNVGLPLPLLPPLPPLPVVVLPPAYSVYGCVPPVVAGPVYRDYRSYDRDGWRDRRDRRFDDRHGHDRR